MDKKKYIELMDDLYDTNNMLEMCRGYAESDTPDITSLAESLFIVLSKYSSLYTALMAAGKELQ